MVRGRVIIMWLSLDLMSDLYSQSFCTEWALYYKVLSQQYSTRERLRPHDFHNFRSRNSPGQGFKKVVVGNLTASDTKTCSHLALACQPLMQIEIFAIAGINNK